MPAFWTPLNQDRIKKEKSWGGSHKLGQSHDEMEQQSKMVGVSKDWKSFVKTAEGFCAKEPWEEMRTTR